MTFKDKVILITWASKWIWRTTALLFWKEWAIVIVNYNKSKIEANKVAKNIEKLWWKALVIKCDISIEEEVINMVNLIISKFKKIDILINNAWISNDVPIFERTVEQWRRTMDVNLLWTFLCSKYVIKEMMKKWEWKIVNLWSINWTKDFYPEQIDYDISKAWIITLTKEFAKIAWENIRVNTLAPWNIDNYDEENPTWDPSDDELNKVYLRRHWSILEVWKAILFLSWDNSSFINGTTLFLDGWFN